VHTTYYGVAITRRLSLGGSLKLQVSLAEYGLSHRGLLQKRPTILRSLLVVATPYEYILTGYTNDALQHTATHCNTLQYTATYCNTLQHMHISMCVHDIFIHMMHCNTLQHTATHCNTCIYLCVCMTYLYI